MGIVTLCVIDAIDDEPCDREAVITLVLGCVHEHLGPTPLCQYDVESAAFGKVWCPTCYAHDQHRCPLTVLAEVTEDGGHRAVRP